MNRRLGLFIACLLAAAPAVANDCDVSSMEDCAVIRLVNETGVYLNWIYIQGVLASSLSVHEAEDRVLQPEAGRISIDWFHDHPFPSTDKDEWHGWVAGVDQCKIMTVVLRAGRLDVGPSYPKPCRRERLQQEALRAQQQREAEEKARREAAAAAQAKAQRDAAEKARLERSQEAARAVATPAAALAATPDAAELWRRRAAEEAEARARAIERERAEAARLQREAIEREKARQAAEAAKVQAEIDRRNQFNQELAAGEADRNARFMSEAESTMDRAERHDRIEARAATAKALSSWKPPVKAGGSAGALDLGDPGRATPTPTPRAEPTTTPKPR